MLKRITLRLGWLTLAVPGLTAVTIAVLVSGPTDTMPRSTPFSISTATATIAPQAHDTTFAVEEPAATPIDQAPKPYELPTGPLYTQQGTGTFTVVLGNGPVVGRGPVVRYEVAVERGLSDVAPAAFAEQVDATLDNAQGWTARGDVALQRVDAGADWTVVLASAMTVRTLCGYEIPAETSCWDPNDRRVVINNARWVRGAVAYESDIAAYRAYAVSHEVAHALGHGHAHQCLPDGRAPVMMQQTLGTRSTTGGLCRPNSWPYPTGVASTPGAEAADTPQNSQYVLSGG